MSVRDGANALIVTLVVALAGVASGGARAAAGEEASTRAAARAARAHFQHGELLYVKAQYAEALVEFEAGYAAVPLPGFLVNIGQCRRRLGDMTAARAAYEQFLARAPNSPLAAAVRDLVRELALTPPPLVVTSPAAVAIGTDPGSPRSPAPPTAPRLALRASPRSSPRTAGTEIAVDDHDRTPPAAAASRHWWWVWGGLGLVTIAASALVLSSGGGSTTTIHEGTLGTLRR